MKTSVYIATVIITLSTLSTAGFLMLKSAGPKLPATVQGEQAIQINWGEGVDVHGSTERVEDTRIAQN
jgi:hypothetical protein